MNQAAAVSGRGSASMRAPPEYKGSDGPCRFDAGTLNGARPRPPGGDARLVLALDGYGSNARLLIVPDLGHQFRADVAATAMAFAAMAAVTPRGSGDPGDRVAAGRCFTLCSLVFWAEDQHRRGCWRRRGAEERAAAAQWVACSSATRRDALARMPAQSTLTFTMCSDLLTGRRDVFIVRVTRPITGRRT